MAYPPISKFLIFIVGLTFSYWIWITGSFEISDMTVSWLDNSQPSRKLSSSSFQEKTEEQKVLLFEATVKQSLLSPKMLTLKVDDCLQELSINNHFIANKNLPYCNFKAPISIPLSNLELGSQFKLNAKMLNHGGPAEFTIIKRSIDSPVQACFFISILISFFYLLSFIFQKRISSLACLIISLGLISRAVWFLFVSYSSYAHDLDAHIDYLNWILEKGTLPKSTDGFLFFHPPLYYLTAAILHKFLAIIQIQLEIADLAYFLSFIYANVSLMAGVLAIILCFRGKSENQKVLALAILCLLPSSILSPIAINNDSLSNMLCSLIFLVSLLWWQNPKIKLWIILGLLGTLALATKFSSLPIVLLIPVFALLKFRGITKEFIKLVLIYSLLLGLFLLPYGLIRYSQKTPLALIGNTSNLDPALKLDNTPSNFITFSPKTFFTTPYLSAWDDASRRAYPLEALFRSSFTGEFDLGEKGKAPLAVLHGLACLFIIFAVIGIFARSSPFKLQVLLALLVTLLSILANRYLNPYGCSVNMRYSTYIIALFAILVGFGLPKFLKDQGKISNFIITSILIFWGYNSSRLLFVFINGN